MVQEVVIEITIMHHPYSGTWSRVQWTDQPVRKVPWTFEPGECMTLTCQPWPAESVGSWPPACRCPARAGWSTGSCSTRRACWGTERRHRMTQTIHVSHVTCRMLQPPVGQCVLGDGPSLHEGRHRDVAETPPHLLQLGQGSTSEVMRLNHQQPQIWPRVLRVPAGLDTRLLHLY